MISGISIAPTENVNMLRSSLVAQRTQPSERSPNQLNRVTTLPTLSYRIFAEAGRQTRHANSYPDTVQRKFSDRGLAPSHPTEFQAAHFPQLW